MSLKSKLAKGLGAVFFFSGCVQPAGSVGCHDFEKNLELFVQAQGNDRLGYYDILKGCGGEGAEFCRAKITAEQSSPDEIVAALALLGAFGVEGDAELVVSFLEHDEPRVRGGRL